MNPIQIISASAGSGKTYRLAQLLEDEVKAGRVRPEAVLATTFTKKAAAQLQERVRVKLLSAGRSADAHRLSAARMGTVNAICGRLVGDFSFELGLSPQLQVLDDEMAAAALRRALATVMSSEEEAELAGLSERLVEFVWQEEVQCVVDLARANGMDAQQVRACAARSTGGFIELLGRPAAGAEALDRELECSLTLFVNRVRTSNDGKKNTAAAMETAENALRRLKAGVQLPWKDWLALAKLAPAKAFDPVAEVVRTAASAQDRHPRLHADVSRAIQLVFELAARSLEAYQQHKRELGALDFVDQEKLALELLGREHVQEQLREDLDLVLVDEFQDTSPIQLAIFLKLAGIAPHSVWVGDQKQAIYGFRGTDPALMDAAINAILGGQEPQTLPKSYRSRPELVRFTSALFAPAFALKGIPAGRVRLEPASKEEPEGLGVVLECWKLAARNQSQDAAALAAAIKQLLEDDVKIRDTHNGRSRKLRPGDVAVLCRKNDTCAALAQELAALGIQAVLPRTGLLGTLEARAVLAGLRRWVNGQDALAAAELGRLITYAGNEDRWLAASLATPGHEAFSKTPVIKAVDAACEQQPKLGALAAFDAVVEAIDAQTLCLAWGDAEIRLSNLEALRGHAVAYAQLCAATGTGCTPAGLVLHLQQLAQDQADSQGVRVDEQSVVVSTWHSAKGLEWPVTVLFDLNRREPQVLGVQAVADRDTVDLADPLAGRWIRYWPSPYSSRNNGMPFHTRLAEHPATAAAQEQSAREDLRLLYVGWTRARDRVVLAARSGKLTEGRLALLCGPKGSLVNEPDGQEIRWADWKLAVTVREAAPLARVESQPQPGECYVAAGAKDHPPAFIQPSQVAVTGTIPGSFEQIHPRLAISGKPDWSSLGNAVHGFLCGDRPGLSDAARGEQAQGILRRWGVLSALSPADLILSSDALRSWVEKTWLQAKWHREWPLLHRLTNGSLIRGSADLVLEMKSGFVLLDHKSFPGSVAEAMKKAAEFTGQVKAYGQAIAAATAWPWKASFIHLPVLGIVVPVQ